MIEIKKQKEPKKLLEYRQQIGASYEHMDKEVKEELLNSLLIEQGHLCAYCMKKIPEAGNKNPNIPKVTIEHWYPRNPQNQSNEEQGLNYRNMFAVCSGNRGCGNEDNMTCDAHRKNEILKVKPSDVNTLYGITYTSDGYIKSSDEHINNDLNQKLNLNCISSSLPENRKQALNELIKYVQNNHPQGDISLFCKRKLQQLQNINDPKPPFVGILLWWLERKQIEVSIYNFA